MAFGRSNSLSINTGATNSLFTQQQQQGQNASSQPPPAGGPFGGGTSQPSQAGSLFGGAAATQPQQGSGLFGSSTQPQQPPQPPQQPQQQQGGLFGSTQQQQQSNMPPPQQQGGGLFGGSLNQPTQQQSQQQQGGSSLFGGAAPQNRPSNSLFGAASTANATTGGSSLFGGGSSLIGGNTQNQQTAQTSSLFAPRPQQQQQAPSNSIFGLSAQDPQAPSLLNASQYRGAQYPSFAGKLTMGQAPTPAAQPSGGPQGAVKIDYETMRPTTRFTDCIDEIKNQLESIDKMIQSQERFCREIESFLPKHGEDVKSLAPDVELIKEMAESVEYAFSMDAQGVQTQRGILGKDTKDFERCQRVVDNLRLAPQYQYTGFGGSSATGVDGDVAKDMDLIGNYFKPLASEQQMALETYVSNLAEIEGHMRVIEASAVMQAQHLAAKRAGVPGSGQGGGEDTVRELADTLRGFEQSILGAAGLVGQCREGVNELVLGRSSSGLRGR